MEAAATLSSGFLQKDPDSWNDDNDFLRTSSIAQELKVVNDHAERGVALVKVVVVIYCRASTNIKKKNNIEILHDDIILHDEKERKTMKMSPERQLGRRLKSSGVR